MPLRVGDPLFGCLFDHERGAVVAVPIGIITEAAGDHVMCGGVSFTFEVDPVFGTLAEADAAAALLNRAPELIRRELPSSPDS
jgi:hypothetical protein